MSRIYDAAWSARTRGVRWKTVTGRATITASGIHVAAMRTMKQAEREARAKIGAVTIHLEEVGTTRPKPRPMTQREEDEHNYQNDVVRPAIDRIERMRS